MAADKNVSNQRELKKKVEFFHLDGIVDIVSGAVLLNFGLDVINQSTTTSFFTYLPIVLYNSIKNEVFFGRIAEEEFNVEEQRVRKWNFSILVGTIFTVVALGMLVLGNTIHIPSWLSGGNAPALIAGVLISFACAIAAFFIPIRRFWVYALIALLTGILAFFSFPTYVPVFASALAMIVWGTRLMVQFTKDHPKEAETKEK